MSAEEHKNLALNMFDSGDYKGAIIELNKALSIDASDPYLHSLLGYIKPNLKIFVEQLMLCP